MPIAIMSRSAPQIIVFLVLVIYLTGSLGSSNSGDGEPKIRCKEAERRALLKIKEDLQEYEDDVLSSWGKEEEKRECCEWIGIRCDNETGHIISLDLSPPTFHSNEYFSSSLGGNISSSLVDLEYLNYLDLSCVDFYDNSIPSFIGTFSKLRYLNLSFTSLNGEVPPQLGNLSGLQVLDLRRTDLEIRNLEWASRLTSLQLLDLSDANMSRAHDWVQVVNNLPCLKKLMLSNCDLPDSVTPHLSLANSSKVLSILDLSWNDDIFASILQWLFNYSRSLVHLDLRGSHIKTSIPESFGNMAVLSYLDLSYNQFNDSIPEFFGNMSALTHLEFHNNQFIGSIPESFGHMAALTYLDLSYNQFNDSIPESFGNMSALTHLELHNNQFIGSIPESFGNMSALEYLDLSNNMLEGEIPTSIWRICTLRDLQAYGNNLSGELSLSKSISKCAHFPLEQLDLSLNRLTGSLPNFTLYSSLVELYLGSNQFNGSISKSVGQLSKLQILDVSENSITTVMYEAHFSKLFDLSRLDLSSNQQIVFNVPSDWHPPFQLSHINLRSCKLGPYFPKWLQTQRNFLKLDISSNRISDSIPYWFWKLPNHNTQEIYLSNNEIMGTIHDDKQGDTQSSYLSTDEMWAVDIDLSANQLEGSIPIFLLYMTGALNLSSNRFTELNSFCNLTTSASLKFLDVSSNQLTGELTDCWSNFENLEVLILANNKLTGKIPISIGSLTQVWSLHLSNNNLTAELPSSFKSLKSLQVFNVGENNLSGPVPAWMGNKLKHLVVLSLRSNNFYGSIPSQLCHLQDLKVLDLSLNNLSSNIPTCLGNITAMKGIESTDLDIGRRMQLGTTLSDVLNNRQAAISSYNRRAAKDIYNRRAAKGFYKFNSRATFKSYNDKLPLIWKGLEREFKNIWILHNIDLSSNKLVGEIPREITELIGLNSLNLSRNNLSGRIPEEIGQLIAIDALDLSRNHFFGQIPPSLSQIHRLNTLDLSSNNLSGQIPRGTQLQTRDKAAFMDNPELCGEPLPKNCTYEEEPSPHGPTKDDQDDFITNGFYISIAIGFIVGFWGVCGSLIFNKSWRYRYLKFLDNKADWLYVTIVVNKAKLLRVIKR